MNLETGEGMISADYGIAVMLIITFALQAYLLVVHPHRLTPRALASRWCIAGAVLGLAWRVCTLLWYGDPAISVYTLLLSFLLCLGISGLALETIQGIRHHNRRVTDPADAPCVTGLKA